VGYSSETKNGVTRVVAGSSPFVVSLSVLGIIFFIFLMSRELRVGTSQAASLRRRFVAFLFDCWFLLLTVVGVSSLLHLLLEAERSGTFRWRYEQESGIGPDGADAVLMLVNLTAMFMYFVLPLARRRQTVGQWLFSLATVSAGGSVLYLPFSTALWRTFMAFRGLISPWRFLKETDTQGRTWYDRETGFTVVRF
jgi:RDD family